MKANRKFINADDAVSPVIAVILMVAITVVLAATVFVLVNDLGKNVGSTGPSLGMISDAAGSSTSKWTVKLSSATQLADLGDYRFVVTTPSNGTMVFVPDNNTFDGADAASTNIQYLSRPDGTTGRGEGVAHGEADAPDIDGAGWVGFRIWWTDIDGNDKFSVGDTTVLTFDDDINDEGTPDNLFNDPFPNGSYTLEVLHTPSGSSAGSLPRTF